MAAAAGEPATSILARVDRLDLVLAYLEELRGRRTTALLPSPASSGPMTSSDVEAAGEYYSSTRDTSPGSVSSRRRCWSIEEAAVEVQTKGSIIDRVDLLEARVLKIEEEMLRGAAAVGGEEDKKGRQRQQQRQAKGLKKLVRSCVKGI